MKVALFGGTGFVGSYIIDELLSHKYSPKLLVRESSEKKLLKASKCEIIVGDLTNKAAMAKLIKSADVVIYSIGLVREFPHKGITFQETQFDGVKDSVDLAKEKGACTYSDRTKYAQGILPIDTYKKDVDELVKHQERADWKALRKQLKETGIRNSTLMALMPAETSAQISNSTNGVEPPRSYISVKQSKHGALRQVVPEFKRLKNKYELLWDQKSPEGYLKIMAILQKYIDQGISVNTSYNPEHYDDSKIPMSVMIQDLVTAYKYGLKQLYYFNTHDGSGEMKDIELPDLTFTEDEEDCDSCKI